MEANKLFQISSTIPFLFTKEGRPDRLIDTRPIHSLNKRKEDFLILMSTLPYSDFEDGLGPCDYWFVTTPLLSMPVVIKSLLYLPNLQIEYDIFAEDRGLVKDKMKEFLTIDDLYFEWSYTGL
ncbi:MAG: hypothetical protein ACRCXZ_09600 [Patescibacteria group bacterium]